MVPGASSAGSTRSLNLLFPSSRCDSELGPHVDRASNVPNLAQGLEVWSLTDYPVTSASNEKSPTVPLSHDFPLVAT